MCQPAVEILNMWCDSLSNRFDVTCVFMKNSWISQQTKLNSLGLSRFNYDAVPSVKRWTYPLPYYSVFCCWYITLRCDLDLWPWTPAAYRLWINETLYQIWTQSSTSFDLMTLNITLRVALVSGIMFTKFDLRQLFRAWIVARLMLMRYVTRWSWTLIRWPWKVHQASRSTIGPEISPTPPLIFTGAKKCEIWHRVQHHSSLGRRRLKMLSDLSQWFTSMTVWVGREDASSDSVTLK